MRCVSMAGRAYLQTYVEHQLVLCLDWVTDDVLSC